MLLLLSPSLLLLLSLSPASGRSAGGLMRSAPLRCPIDAENTLDIQLFVSGEEECFKLCERTDGCHFYRFYRPHPSFTHFSGLPTQCYLFRSCGRNVERASPDCQLNSENTVRVEPFVKSETECKELCQAESQCGYFKYYPSSSFSSPLLDNTLGALLRPNSSSVAASAVISVGSGVTAGGDLVGGRSGGTASRAEFCYVLRSCSKRMVDNLECTLGKNNFLDVRMFVTRLEDCREHCVKTEGCRYYYWYPINRSSRPQYCYLYRQCAAKDSEPEVAFVVGGRHPGHYYITSQEHNDFVMRNEVCMVGSRADADDLLLARAGAVAQYSAGSGGALLCGGRVGVGEDDDGGFYDSGAAVMTGASAKESRKDCLLYEPEEDLWTHHSDMMHARDEASMVSLGENRVMVLGGIGRDDTEVYTVVEGEGKWEEGPAMPAVFARGCAVAPNDSVVIVVGGHDNSSTNSLPTTSSLDLESGLWRTDLPEMNVPRRDHACLFVEFETKSGVLVTGGLGDNDEVLDSAEFLDLRTMRWTLTSSLKQGRTEHGMSLVYGIPTVIGGISNSEFLSSVEQFDKSSASWNVPLERDWRTVNSALSVPRYEMAVASVPVSRVKACDADIV